MSLVNTWVYTHTEFDGEKFLSATHNKYRLVSVKPYTDKNGKLSDGYRMTLMIIKDDSDYGVDKETGEARETNLYQNFDVTVLSRHDNPKKGDMVKLIDFDSEHSYVIGFDLCLRFRDFQLIQTDSSQNKTIHV